MCKAKRSSRRLGQIFYALAFMWPAMASAEQSSVIKIIEPGEKKKPAKPAMIDTEKFQLGAYAGVIQIEDFGSSGVTGLSAAYQIAEDYLLMFHTAKAKPDKNVIETTVGFDRTPGSLRDFSYTTLSGAYRLFKTRSFLGARLKYDSDLYASAGLGRTTFADYTGNGITLALSYRVVVTDWMVINLDMKDHIYDQLDVYDPFSAVEASGHTKMTQNIECSFGINALF